MKFVVLISFVLRFAHTSIYTLIYAVDGQWLSLSFFCRVLKPLWACWIVLGGGCGSLRTSRVYPRVSYVDMHLAAGYNGYG